MSDMKIFIYLILINTIISFSSFFVIYKKDLIKAVFMLIFMMVCPVVGFSFFAVSWFLKLLFHKKEINIDDLSFNTEKLEMIERPDFEKEINVVPVEEALLVSDNTDKRRVILDVLKDNYEDSLNVITNALDSDDSETSHYVAAMIADVKSNFKITVQSMQENMKQYPNDFEICMILVDYINEFLKKKVLSEIEELTYIELYLGLMEHLYRTNRIHITGSMFKQIIDHLLQVKNMNLAILWAERAINEKPDDLDSYKGLLKLHFETGEREKFFQVLKQLKQSNLPFDKECLDYVRFYQI